MEENEFTPEQIEFIEQLRSRYKDAIESIGFAAFMADCRIFGHRWDNEMELGKIICRKCGRRRELYPNDENL